MHITKFGHCCMLIEERGTRIITDPGRHSTQQNELTNIDAIVITHEHQDHVHMESLKILLKQNPNATVITSTSVGVLLEKERIVYSLVEHGQEIFVQGISFEG